MGTELSIDGLEITRSGKNVSNNCHVAFVLLLTFHSYDGMLPSSAKPKLKPHLSRLNVPTQK